MAAKFPLSIVLQTVDNATAGIQRVIANVDKLAVRQIAAKLSGKGSMGEALGKLAESAGVGKVLGGFSRVGSEITALASKFAMLGVAAAGAGIAAAAALKGIVDKFDNVGDTADKIGITGSELLQLRFAAEVAGASVEDLDAGMLGFSKSMGQMRANKGKMFGFLQDVSPALLKQAKATKSPLEAFDLMADAMAKIKDEGKKTAFAVAVFGGSGASLAPMLSGGSKGIAEMRKRFLGFAGDVEPAIKISGEIDNDLHDLGATFTGLKGKIISALGPTISQLLDKLNKFLVENREKFGEWIEGWAKELPGAISKAIEAFDKVISVASDVWEKIGGVTTVVSVLAGLIAGKLLLSILALSLALVTTPFGWLVLAIGAVIAIGTALVLKWDAIGKFFTDLWTGIKKVFQDGLDFITGIVDGIIEKVGAAIDFLGGNSQLDKLLGTTARDAKREAKENGSLLLGSQGDEPGLGILPSQIRSQAKVTVDFRNAPKGMRVAVDPESTTAVDTNTGYQMDF